MAHALVQARFSEADVIGFAFDSFVGDGWAYIGFLPGPQVSSGTSFAFAGLGETRTTVDTLSYLIFYRPGKVKDYKGGLASWFVSHYAGRASLYDEDTRVSVGGPPTDAVSHP